jgi:hypothetical protein
MKKERKIYHHLQTYTREREEKEKVTTTATTIYSNPPHHLPFPNAIKH